jgi:hypothetical protein
MKITIDLRVFVDEFAKHLQLESRLLYPNPQHYVFAVDALDALASAGADKETIGRLLDEAQEQPCASRPSPTAAPSPTETPRST